VNGHTVRYVDTDGDLATVHISKGRLTTTGQNPVLNFTAVNAIGGRTLQMIDFTTNRIAFNHTDVSVTADLQPGFSASGGKSDGLVNVGQIRGASRLGMCSRFSTTSTLATSSWKAISVRSSPGTRSRRIVRSRA
jgi:hypothetical protein